MADLTITPSSVVKGTGASVTDGTAGGTIAQGDSVYFDSATNTWKRAQADGTAEEAGASGVGIALNGASSGQPVKVQTSGPNTIGATVTVGQSYVVSATAGGIAPLADLVSTNRVTPLGWGISATQLSLSPLYLGVQKP